jgi:hypothetical protein
MKIFLNDNDFKHKDKYIVDECLTFYLSGRKPSLAASCNMLLYTTMDTFV